MNAPAVDLRADYHGHAIEYACDLDRAYFKDHPGAAEYVRAAVDHEVCVPGGPCLRASRVRVIQVEPGVRLRIPELQS